MEFTHIFFDADNTIVDFTIASKRSLDVLFELYEIQSSPVIIKRFKEINIKCWKAFERGEMNKRELTFQRFNQFFNEIGVSRNPQIANDKYLRLLVEHSELLPGAEKLLNNLKSRYQLHLITNGFREVQRPKFTKLGIDHFFSTIVVSDEIGMKKPETRFFDYCLEKAGNPNRNEVIVIGDSLSSDISGANNSRLKSIWYNPARLSPDHDVKADYIINELHEILDIL